MTDRYDDARRRPSRGRRHAPWGLLIAVGAAAGAAGAVLLDGYAPSVERTAESAQGRAAAVSVASTRDPLAAAPSETSAPAVAEDSQIAALTALWAAPPTARAAARPVLAVVLRGPGDDPALAMRALNLEAPITLGVNAAAPDAKALAAAARRRGREVVALIPVSAGSDRPRDGALSARYGPGENARRAAAFLDAFPAYAAISPIGAPQARLDPSVMGALAAAAAAADAPLLDGAPYGQSVGARAARQVGIIARDVDAFAAPNDRAAAWRAFEEAEGAARFWGDAVVVAELDAETLRALELWLAESARPLAPLSQVLNRPPHEPAAEAAPPAAAANRNEG